MTILDFLLKNLSSEDQKRFKRIGEKRSFKRNQVVFSAGDKATHVFVLLDGAIKFIAPESKDRDEAFINLIRKDGIFGLWAALNNEDRIADAIALDDTDIMAFPKEDFMEMVSINPENAKYMVEHLALAIREMEVWSLNLRTMDAKARLAKHLLVRHKRKKGETFRILRLKDLASYLNMEPETISRMFASFVKKKYIKKNHRMITVIDVDGLTKELS